MYTKEEEAIHFVFKAFKGKKRIKEDIDLAFHSISIGFMLKEINCEENIVLSGFLHDIIEDSDFGYDDIKLKFCSYIADNVLKLSENKKILDWKSRKMEFFDRLNTYNKNIILVELCDKLQSLLSDYSLFLKN